MTVYRIVRIGSLQTGWAIERDGINHGSHPSAEVLGARPQHVLRNDVAECSIRTEVPDYLVGALGVPVPPPGAIDGLPSLPPSSFAAAVGLAGLAVALR